LSAPAHTSHHAPVRGGVEVRLPWCGVVLPAIAFAALLRLISVPGQAHAAAGDTAIVHVLQRIQDSLSR
jgi:hypothetical protein